jgi:hypothetical protein
LGTPLTCSSSHLTYSSSNPDLVSPFDGVAWSGTWPNCIGTVTPVAAASGSADLTFTISDGISTASKTFTLSVISAPGIVRFLGVESGRNGEAILNWTAPASGTAPSSYKIFRSLTSSVDTSGSPISTINATNLTYTDTGRTNGTSYYYKVLATNSGVDAPNASLAMRALPLNPSSTTQDLNNIFISPTGNDTTGNGSIGNPYQSLYKAIDVVNASGTIFIKDGTYTTSVVGHLPYPKQ